MKFLQVLVLSVLTLLSQAQNCQPGQNFFEGQCYKIIPGCFMYESTTKCSKCANGFQLNSLTSLCERQQIANPPKQNTSPAVKGVPVNVRVVHDFIIANNPEFRGLQYTSYQTINTRLGQLITILFKFDRFTVLVTCEGDVKEIIYGNVRAEYDDPVKIISLIQELYAKQMQGFQALQVEATEDIYEIDFINQQMKRAVRVEVDRQKIDKFETSFKIGTFQYNRVYEMHINQYLKSVNSTIKPSDLRNIRDYANNQFIVYQYAEGSVSASLAKCSFIINDFVHIGALSYNYNYDEQFFKAYSATIRLLPFEQFPPIKRVVRNVKIDGASLYTIEYSSGNRQYMNDIDFQIVIEQKNSIYKLLSLRLNYQYILEDVLNGSNQVYEKMVECFSINYIGSYCQNCQNYYEYLREGDICFRVSGEKCQEYSKTSKKCLRCIQGYDLDEEDNCQASSVVIPYCEVIVNKTCRKCAEGYDLNGTGGCRELDPLCLMNRGPICEICVPTFLSVNGTCVRQIPYCESYNTDGCVQCRYNYILKQSHPYSLCEPFVPDPLCIQYQNNLCQRCLEGYFLSINSICYQKIQGCWNYDSYTGKCQSCKVGLRVFRNRCIQLKDHVINCATDRQYKYCQQCSNGVGQYIIQNGRCQCQQGYYFFSDACVPRIQNCQYVNVNTFGCQICFEGFFLFSGKCAKPIEGCFTYNDEGVCMRCDRGRELYEENGVTICRYSLFG